MPSCACPSSAARDFAVVDYNIVTAELVNAVNCLRSDVEKMQRKLAYTDRLLNIVFASLCIGAVFMFMCA